MVDVQIRERTTINIVQRVHFIQRSKYFTPTIIWNRMKGFLSKDRRFTPIIMDGITKVFRQNSQSTLTHFHSTLSFILCSLHNGIKTDRNVGFVNTLFAITTGNIETCTYPYYE